MKTKNTKTGKTLAFCLLCFLVTVSIFAQVGLVQAASTVNNISTVCDRYQFKNTGWNIIPFSVEMPASMTYAYIYANMTNFGDPSSRYFRIYVNGVQVTQQIAPTGGYTITPVNILSYLHSGMNTVGLTLTTWEIPTGVYWLVSSQINVKYTASKHILPNKSLFAPYYKFRNTGWNIVNFGAEVPVGLVSGSIQVSCQNFGDPSTRLLKVYVDGAEITPSGGVNIGRTTYTWPSPDITSKLAMKKYVKIGITLTTWESPSGVYWRVSASLSCNARYYVWPDTDTRWMSDIHILGDGGTTLYDTATSDHENQILGTTAFEVKAKELDQHPRFYVGMLTYSPDFAKQAYDVPWWVGTNVGLFIKHEFHIKIKDPSGNPLNPNIYITVITADVSPSTTGADVVGIASDMIKIGGLIASGLGQPLIGVPLSIAAVLIRYVAPPGWPEPFSYGTESTGVYLSDGRGILSKLSDLLMFTVDFPATGTYTFEMTQTITVTHGFTVTFDLHPGTVYWETLCQHTWTYSAPYQYF